MTDSTTSPSPDKSVAKTLFTVRYVIPAVLALVGLVPLFVLSSPLGVEAWALFTAAGLSVLLLNVLFRLGIPRVTSSATVRTLRGPTSTSTARGQTRRSGRPDGAGAFRKAP